MSENSDLKWIHEEFSSHSFSDERLHKRLLKITEAFSKSPSLSINQACAEWAAIKGAYRFFDNVNVSSDLILEPHFKTTLERCFGEERILVIQDGSKINFDSHHATEGLGSYCANDRFETKGLITHTALAINTEGVPLGVIAQKTWARDIPDSVKKMSPYDSFNRPIEDKESYSWIETIQHAKKRLPEKGIIIVGDRENDIYEFFQEALLEDVQFVVRSCYSRVIEDEFGLYENLNKKLKNLPEMGRVCLHLPSRKGVKARSASLELRYTEVMLIPAPRGIKTQKTKTRIEVPLFVVELKEMNPPKGIKGLD